MFSEPISTFIVMPVSYCAIGCHHWTLNRLFGCVFLVWRHHLRKVNKWSIALSNAFFHFFLFFDVPQYSNGFDYIKDIRSAVNFNNQKNHCISSLTSSNFGNLTAFTAIFSHIFTAHAQERPFMNFRLKFWHHHSIPWSRFRYCMAL